MSNRCAIDPAGAKRIVFYGAGDAAEIAFVSLQRTDLRLTAVVDDRKRGVFFGLPIESPDILTDDQRGAPYLHIVVTSIRHASAILARLDARSIGRDRVSCL